MRFVIPLPGQRKLRFWSWLAGGQWTLKITLQQAPIVEREHG